MAEEKAEKETDSDTADITDKLRENPWIISTIVAGLFVLVLLFFMFKGGITGNVISGEDAGNNLIDFAKTQGVDVEVLNVVDSGSFYEIEANVNGQQGLYPITKDGKFLLSGMIPLTEEPESENPTEIPKSDKPQVELFVMTYCPYGTQAEKGIIPVIKALGNKVDAKIRFVHYFMHGDQEEQETYRQLCIRETLPSKFSSYLECFLGAGDSLSCMSKLGINVDSCMSSSGKEYYASDSKLSQQYGVQGSPTLIINGAEVSSARSPEAFLTTICSAFNTPPSECSQQLSTSAPDPGFGTTSSGSSDSAASCG